MVQIKPGESLYQAIGLEKAASAGEIRKAYLRLAVQLHPDKNPGDEEAKERFQTLQKVYTVLSDPERKKLYDETGCFEDEDAEFSSQQFDAFASYYRTMFQPVTEEAIDTFASSYQGSPEERADVLQYYSKFEGDMTAVFDWVILSNPEVDSHRFMDIVEDSISKNEVKRHASYTAWAKKVAKKLRGRSDSTLAQKKNRSGRRANEGKGSKGGTKGKRKFGDEGAEASTAALVAAMSRKREGTFNSMLNSLTERYGVELPPEPTDEEFEAARKRVEAGKKATKNKP